MLLSYGIPFLIIFFLKRIPLKNIFFAYNDLAVWVFLYSQNQSKCDMYEITFSNQCRPLPGCLTWRPCFSGVHNHFLLPLPINPPQSPLFHDVCPCILANRPSGAFVICRYRTNIKISGAHQIIMWFSGLRGAIASKSLC